MDGKIVGFLNIKIATSPDLPIFKKAKYVLIEDCVVDANHRRQGIGTALFYGAKRWSKERGMSKIQLTVWAKNEAARNLYKKLGFNDLIGKMGADPSIY